MPRRRCDSSRCRAEAGRCFGTDPRIELRVGDARELPYTGDAFDGVPLDRVLIFLRDPRRALAESVRVCRPGGRIAVTESDLGSAVVDSADLRTTRIMLEAASAAMARPWIGRELRGLFADCQLRDVEVELFPMQSTSFDDWRHRMGIGPAVAALVEAGSVAPPVAAAWLDDLRMRDATGRFYAATSFFMASGTK